MIRRVWGRDPVCDSNEESSERTAEICAEDGDLSGILTERDADALEKKDHGNHGERKGDKATDAACHEDANERHRPDETGVNQRST